MCLPISVQDIPDYGLRIGKIEHSAAQKMNYSVYPLIFTIRRDSPVFIRVSRGEGCSMNLYPTFTSKSFRTENTKCCQVELRVKVWWRYFYQPSPSEIPINTGVSPQKVKVEGFLTKWRFFMECAAIHPMLSLGSMAALFILIKRRKNGVTTAL